MDSRRSERRKTANQSSGERKPKWAEARRPLFNGGGRGGSNFQSIGRGGTSTGNGYNTSNYRGYNNGSGSTFRETPTASTTAAMEADRVFLEAVEAEAERHTTAVETAAMEAALVLSEEEEVERLTTAVVQVQALATNLTTPEDQPPTATTTAQTEHQTATATTCTTTATDMDSKTTSETDTRTMTRETTATAQPQPTNTSMETD